jgi:voltage-gated potassium channel
VQLIEKIKDFLHWESTKKPDIDLNTELYEQLGPFRLPLILTVLMMLVGTLGYMFIDDFSLSDAIYQTGITFTTVGFGEIAPISEMGRLFTITLIIVGFGVFSFSVGILVEVLNKGDLIRVIKERSMLYKVARLKNHFVVCYHNKYTIQLSYQFREAHIPFVVIDPDENFLEEAKKQNYPFYFKEEPHSTEALLKANLSSAKGVITLSENIADNIAQIASVRLYQTELKRKPFYIMTNANTIDDIEKLKKLGANSVISPTKLMAQRISAMSLRPDMENLLEEFLYKKDTPLDIVELTVHNHSWIRFKKLKETHLRDIVNVSVVGIRNKDGKFIPMPDGETLITSGSKLLVVGTAESIKETKKLIRKKVQPKELIYV